MKKQTFYLLLILFVTVSTSSCREDKRKTTAENIVTEWIGKQIIFPSEVRCTYMRKDTLCPNVNTPYKILIYTDSIGCTSCKLQLYKWNSLIEETAELMPGKVSFLFYFHPKDEKDLHFLLKRDNFKEYVYMDSGDKLNRANKFPGETNYQCFLLDRDNKVVLIGNPTLNHRVWELYKQAITGNGDVKPGSTERTTIRVEQPEIELEGLKKDEISTATFLVKNTGDIPLVIKDITASCGCTVPNWDKHPIRPGESAEIKVKVTPDASGYFRKTITVFCNTEEGIVRLAVKGIVKD